MLNCVILGASGYTGAELIRLLCVHPEVRIVALSANTQAGVEITTVFPHMTGAHLPVLCATEEVDYSNIDVVFCCLPHATTQKILNTIPLHVRIIDLSADFRLRNPADYTKWYGEPHLAEDLQKDAVYGLTEHYRNAIKHARLVANPGCYPTSSLLGLIPLLKAGFIKTDNIIIDAKSGVSGAGRAVKQNLLYNEIAEGLSPYSVNNHRHMGELLQEITAFSEQKSFPQTLPKQDCNVTFVPHLIPMRRGMITTTYANLNKDMSYQDAQYCLQHAYENEYFIHVLPEGLVPSTHNVRGSNHCHINMVKGSAPAQIIIISAIDNLMKGASGQAVQNMNVMFGFEETTGISGGALFP